LVEPHGLVSNGEQAPEQVTAPTFLVANMPANYI
jgi:hypothetical protein